MTQTTYAIGDVHGRADLLERLLTAIADEAADAGAEPRVIFIGDIVSHGPDSRLALDLVGQALGEWPESRLILGNHEEYLLRFANGEHCGAGSAGGALEGQWSRDDRAKTFRSYGLDPNRSLAALAGKFRQRFPDHVALLRRASSIIIDPRFVFVHAGVDPDVPMEEQDARTTRWIRKGFLDCDHRLSHMVVHGHTKTDSARPEITPCRVALDTGAFATGRLTCLIVPPPGSGLRFLATRQTARRIAVEEIKPVYLGCKSAALSA